MPHDDIDRACRLHDRAVAARAGGKCDQAESLGQRALALLEKAAGADHPDVANVLNHLAGVHVDRSDYAKAERLYRRAVRILERASARLQSPWDSRSAAPGRPKHVRPASARSPAFRRHDVRTTNGAGKPNRHGQSNALPPEGGTPNNQDADVIRLHVQSLGDLASLYRVQGRYAEAEPLFKQALKIAEKTFASDDLEVSSVLNNLAVLYKYRNRFPQAERLYRRALAIVEKSLGPEHPEVATIYHNLGGLEHERGRYARGEPLARRSVEIRQKALGPDHPEVAADLAALAALLDGQGKDNEAEQLYKRALAIFERAYGPEHYDLAVCFNNLAAIRHKQGDHTEAERLYQRALAIKEELLGPNHPDVAMTLNNLAVSCKSQGRQAEAESLYQRALSIFKKALGSKHPKVALCQENLAQLRRQTSPRRQIGEHTRPRVFRPAPSPVCV